VWRYLASGLKCTVSFGFTTTDHYSRRHSVAVRLSETVFTVWHAEARQYTQGLTPTYLNRVIAHAPRPGTAASAGPRTYRRLRRNHGPGS